jgi:HPt (histidine-containing phosphotransfer) domain-containing protein
MDTAFDRDTTTCEHASLGCLAARDLDLDRTASVLDLGHLRVYTLGPGDFEREIVGLFLTELSKSLSALDRAATPDAWHMAAHSLKGSALGVGAWRLAGAAREAEVARHSTTERRQSALARISKAAADVRVEIARLRLL